MLKFTVIIFRFGLSGDADVHYLSEFPGCFRNALFLSILSLSKDREKRDSISKYLSVKGGFVQLSLNIAAV